MESVQKIAKNGNIMVDVIIKSIPYQLHKEFSELSKKYYNDVYWVTLQDLMRKAEAYDAITTMFGVSQEEKGDDENEN
jgi:hypothetical protein